MKRHIFGLVLIFINAVFIGRANTLPEADSAYNKGNYIEAAEIYSKVAAENGVSPELLSNMGDSYARAGDYGHAMLAYRRALLLNPGMKSLQNNIEYVRSKVADNNTTEIKGKKVSVIPETPSFFSSVRIWIADRHLSDTWAVWALISFLLMLTALCLYIFSESVLIKKIGFFGGFGLLGLTTIFLIFSFMAASDAGRQREGILLGYKVALRTEPYATAKTNGAPLTRGTELSILDRDSIENDSLIWYKVRLNSNYIGWVRSDEFEPVRSGEWLIK